jgi:hypothetical protein
VIAGNAICEDGFERLRTPTRRVLPEAPYLVIQPTDGQQAAPEPIVDEATETVRAEARRQVDDRARRRRARHTAHDSEVALPDEPAAVRHDALLAHAFLEQRGDLDQLAVFEARVAPESRRGRVRRPREVAAEQHGSQHVLVPRPRHPND